MNTLSRKHNNKPYAGSDGKVGGNGINRSNGNGDGNNIISVGNERTTATKILAANAAIVANWVKDTMMIAVMAI
jgi:hypothetical protein